MNIKFFDNQRVDAMDKSFFRKVVKVADKMLKFGYNTQMNYLYFDLYTRDGQIIRYHNKVISNWDFGNFFFTTEEPSTGKVCTANLIDEWQIVIRVL